MTAMLVIKTTNGYAALPYTGTIPADSMADLRIATKIATSYSSGSIALTDVLEEYFEPEDAPEVTSLKVA
jgi:hypothetical protein